MWTSYAAGATYGPTRLFTVLQAPAKCHTATGPRKALNGNVTQLGFLQFSLLTKRVDLTSYVSVATLLFSNASAMRFTQKSTEAADFKQRGDGK